MGQVSNSSLTKPFNSPLITELTDNLNCYFPFFSLREDLNESRVFEVDCERRHKNEVSKERKAKSKLQTPNLSKSRAERFLHELHAVQKWSRTFRLEKKDLRKRKDMTKRAMHKLEVWVEFVQCVIFATRKGCSTKDIRPRNSYNKIVIEKDR